MGTSNWQNISYCVDLIRKVSPQSVLDVGVGFGRWGIICREFLDVWNGRVFREQWTTRIEGVEIFQKNVDKYHAFFYNKIHIMDAYELINNISSKQFDLIILGDVLEHFKKERAINLLHACIKKSDYTLLNVPIGPNWPQGSVYGNEFETHLSSWTIAELELFPILEKREFKDYQSRDFCTFLFYSVRSDQTMENGVCNKNS